MNSRICEMLDIEFPLVAFTHCRDVVVAVSKAGGCGVLGAVGMSPDILEQELKWIDEHIDGKPYGVDVLIPNKMVGKDEKFDPEKLVGMIPQEYAWTLSTFFGFADLAAGPGTKHLRMPTQSSLIEAQVSQGAREKVLRSTQRSTFFKKRARACKTVRNNNKLTMHQPGIAPGSHRWRRCILPLDH